MRGHARQPFLFSLCAALAGLSVAGALHAQDGGLPLVFNLRGSAEELSSIANGAPLTPAAAPEGLTGRLALNGSGKVEFLPAKGVSFGAGYQQRADSAFYRFTGPGVATVFSNLGPGEVSFTWTSLYSFQERSALSRTSIGERYINRTAFHVYNNGSQQYRFDVLVLDGYLAFSYKIGDGAFIYYFVPRGTEDALFGRNVSLHVRLAWDGFGQRTLSFNGAVVQAGAYIPARAPWSNASFSIGARDVPEGGGGYFASDDPIADFQVRNGGMARRPPPSFEILSPADAQAVSGVLAIRIREPQTQPLARARLLIDGAGVAAVFASPFSLFWDTRRVADGMHEVEVEAVDLFGHSAAKKLTVQVSNAAAAARSDTQPPRPVGGFRTVEVTSTSVAFQWNPAEDDTGAVSYTVYRDGAVLGTASGSLSVPSFEDSGLTPAATYVYQIAAVDAAGNVSPRSSPLALTTKPRDGKVLRVGPGAPYAMPCEAFRAAAPFDTVEIDAAGNGSYDGDVCSFKVDNLTIRGVNGRARIDAMGRASQDKGVWVVMGVNNIIENVEISGAVALSGNGAAVRLEGGGLTLRNVYFHHNEDGILTNNVPGTLLIEYSEFAYNGDGTGLTHNMYINRLDRFILRYSYSREVVVGHLVKSRARENYILYNRLTDETGTASYEIDIPNGGTTYVVGNILQQSRTGENNIFVSYGIEGIPSDRDSQLYLINNTFANDLRDCVLVHLPPTAVPAIIQNNILPNCSRLAVPPSRGQFISNVTASAAEFAGPSVFDYTPVPGAAALRAGSVPVADAAGHPIAPLFEYFHQAGGRARAAACNGGRILEGTLDAGAIQVTDPLHGSIGDPLPCDSIVVPEPPPTGGGPSGPGGGTVSGPSLSLSPASVALSSGQQQQFAVTATGGLDPAVRWTLSGPGSLSDTGLYTAPAVISSAASATVTAVSLADPSKSASAGVTLRVPEITTPRLTYAAFSAASLAGGNPASLSLCISAGTPNSVDVTLSSSHPDLLLAPASVILEAGVCVTQRLATAAPAQNTSVTLTVNAGESVRTASLQLTPLRIASLYLFPLEITGGRRSDFSKVTLSSPAPPGGVAVALSSANPALSVPASVTVPAGEVSASFLYSTVAVEGTVPVQIAASTPAGAVSGVVTVQAPTVYTPTITPSVVRGGAPARLAFSINVAPDRNLPVALSSSRPELLPLPAACVVRAGATATSCEFTPAAVAEQTPVTIFVRSGGSVLPLTVVIHP